MSLLACSHPLVSKSVQNAFETDDVPASIEDRSKY
jgi:hypothetical protein